MEKYEVTGLRVLLILSPVDGVFVHVARETLLHDVKPVQALLEAVRERQVRPVAALELIRRGALVVHRLDPVVERGPERYSY